MKLQQNLNLRDVTLVNESLAEELPGDVTVVQTPDEACCWLEAWWVRDEEGMVLPANGDRLHLVPTELVYVRARDPHPDGERLIHLWLHAHAAAVRRARVDTRPLPDTLKGLIEYVGFHR